MIYDVITSLMVVVIIFIMVSTAYDSIKLFRCQKHWLDLFVAILSVIWVGFYIYVLFAEPTNASWVGQVFVRPMNVLTFLALNILIKFRMVGRTTNGNC